MTIFGTSHFTILRPNIFFVYIISVHVLSSMEFRNYFECFSFDEFYGRTLWQLILFDTFCPKNVKMLIYDLQNVDTVLWGILCQSNLIGSWVGIRSFCEVLIFWKLWVNIFLDRLLKKQLQNKSIIVKDFQP